MTPEEAERQRLIAEVDRLRREAEQLRAGWLPTLTSASAFRLSTGPIEIKSVSLSTQAQAQRAWFEVKVWYEDGRYEVIRGRTGTLLIKDKKGAARSLNPGVARKVEEGDTVTLSGEASAWTRDPSGRPKTR